MQWRNAILHRSPSCYPDSSFLVWTQDVYVFLAKRQPSGSRCDAALLQDEGFKKEDIFKWCSVLGQRLAPTGNCIFRWKCICQHASVCTSLISSLLFIWLHFLLAAQYTSTWLSPLWYQTVESQGKAFVLKTCKAMLIIRYFFQVGQYYHNTKSRVWVFSKRSFLLNPEDSKFPEQLWS